MDGVTWVVPSLIVQEAGSGLLTWKRTCSQQQEDKPPCSGISRVSLPASCLLLSRWPQPVPWLSLFRAGRGNRTTLRKSAHTGMGGIWGQFCNLL